VASDVIERTAPVGRQPDERAGVSLRRGGSGGKAAEHAQSTALVPRQRPGSPITNGPTGFVRRHVVRSASREGREHVPYRKYRVIWQFRDVAALPLLASALRDRQGSVWKEALDGLVTLGGQGALDVLLEARTAVANYPDASDRLGWIDEAIGQIQDDMRAGYHRIRADR
jgi:hypothetical protein